MTPATARPSPRPRRPGRPTGGDAAVREALVERARELFLQNGFGNVSTRQIAAAAGTTSAMINYHFGNKLGLYQAMIEQIMRPLIATVAQLGEASRREAPSLEGLIRTYMSMIAANPWFPALMLQEVLSQQGRMRAQFIERYAGRMAPALVIVLRRERELGRLRADLDPQFAAVSLLGLCVFPFVSLPLTGPVLGFRPEGADLDRFIEHTARLFRAGADARPEAAHA